MAGMPFSAYEEHQRRQKEEARLRQEEARKSGAAAQQQALTTPSQVPTSLLKPEVPITSVAELLRQRQGRG